MIEDDVPPPSDADAPAMSPPSNLRLLPSPPQLAPPSSVDMEREALGAALVVPGVFAQLRELVTVDMFSLEKHQLVFRAMCSLDDGGQPAEDPSAVGQRLLDLGDWDRVGGIRTIGELLDRQGYAAHLSHYCGVMRTKWAGRVMQRYAEDVRGIAAEMWDLEAGLTEWDRVHKRTLLAVGGDVKDAESAAGIGDTYRAMLERSKELAANGGTLAMPVGLRPVDDALHGGIWRGEMVTILGRPGMGKSALAAQMVATNCQIGRRCLFVSAEMGAQQVYGRIIARLSGVPFHVQRSGKMSASEEQRVYEATTLIEDNWPLHITTTAGKDIDRVAQYVRRLARQTPLDVIVLDYAQKVPTGRLDGEQALAHISGTWKELAVELDCVSVLLSQPTKAKTDEYPVPRPTMDTARGAQALVADADTFLVCHRRYWGTQEQRSARSFHEIRQAEISIEKHREGSGAGTVVQCAFDGSRMSFVEV